MLCPPGGGGKDCLTDHHKGMSPWEPVALGRVVLVCHCPVGLGWWSWAPCALQDTCLCVYSQTSSVFELKPGGGGSAGGVGMGTDMAWVPACFPQLRQQTPAET